MREAARTRIVRTTEPRGTPSQVTGSIQPCRQAKTDRFLVIVHGTPADSVCASAIVTTTRAQ